MPLTQEEMDRAREGGRRALSFAEGCRVDHEPGYTFGSHRYPMPYSFRGPGLLNTLKRLGYHLFAE